MASHYLLICVFASTFYLTLAFLDASSQLSPYWRITADVYDTHLQQSSSQYELDESDNDHPDDRGKKVRFRSRVAYCGTPFCG